MQGLEGDASTVPENVTVLPLDSDTVFDQSMLLPLVNVWFTTPGVEQLFGTPILVMVPADFPLINISDFKTSETASVVQLMY
jgi:hypothetical protein